MLNGELGDLVALAMKSIVKVGEVLGAEKLIKIPHVHISGISYFNIGDHGLELIEMFNRTGIKFRTFTTANPYAVIDEDFQGSKLNKEVVDKQLRIIDALKTMGAKAFTCTPYYIRRPKFNEHLAWAESNAVLYANSVLGARTNREGGPLALMAAIVGRTYYAGIHVDENIRPCIYVRTIKPNNIAEAGLLGYIIGREAQNCIPFIQGLKGINESMIKSFLAAFGATSNAALAILDGITPLKYDIKQAIYRNLNSSPHVIVGREVIEDELRRVSEDVDKGKVLYIIGCPHLSVHELREIIDIIFRKACRKSNGELWLITYSKRLIPNDTLMKLRRCNVKVLNSVCPVVTKLKLLNVDLVITDSMKAIHYIKKLSNVNALLMDRALIIKRFIR